MTDYAVDILKCADGNELKITFFGHASLMFEYAGHTIYIDPVGDEMCKCQISELPKADVICITHHHTDHFDPEVVEILVQPSTVVVCNGTVYAQLKERFGVSIHCLLMKNGERAIVTPYLRVDAIAAYNTTDGRDVFHPKGRDNGYLLRLGGKNIYVAGDSEPTPEMMLLEDIDIAFLPVNQPYTMTVDQVVEVIKAIKPKVFYPYHYTKTPMQTLVDQLADCSDVAVRIRNMA